MNNNLIKYAVETTENVYFDRKSAKLEPKHIIQHVIAIANASGGDIAVGVENDGSLTGFGYSGAHGADEYEELITKECWQLSGVQYEKVYYGNAKGEFVLFIHIGPSINRVQRNKNGTVYLRVGDKSLELSHEQILQLEYDKGQRRFEAEKVLGSSIDDIDMNLLKEYRRAMNVSDLSDEELLEKRGLIDNGVLTVAGVLLFGKNPTKYYPNARVRFIRYDGTDVKYGSELNIVKEVTFDNPIPKLIHNVIELLKTQLREFQILSIDTGKFEVVPEYPEAAWMEGIVNAVTHRDYSNLGNRIEIRMFDDHIEIVSPGKLPNIVTLDNMKHTQYSRNPQIARVLSELHWVKEMNEGVNRIYMEMKKFFLNDPEYSEPNDNSVKLVLWNNIIMRKMRQGDNLVSKVGIENWGELDDDEKHILQYLSTCECASKKSMEQRLGISASVMLARINYLLDKRIIVAEGSKNSPKRVYRLNL